MAASVESVTTAHRAIEACIAFAPLGYGLSGKRRGAIGAIATYTGGLLP
jgi:hypothetical protein